MENKRTNTEPILEGLLHLRRIISEPRASRVLELEQYPSIEQKKFLVRLIDSLDQYSRASSNLYYIGLMGAFSSGKSSTINSLLGLANSPQARRTSKNPTDKHITFITHPENGESIININKSDNIVILDEYIQHDFLKNIVLIDTPGTGDPQSRAEQVRDSLPVCDLILYLFSATSPYRDDDIPLLNLKFQQLDQIPLLFVITRVDEFKMIKSDKLDRINNFDMRKYEVELDELWRRLEIQFGPSVKAYKQQVIIIDNEEHYNIDQLQASLLERASRAQREGGADVHIHKLNYYIKNAEIIRKFCGDFLNDKIVELEKILDVASVRVTDYRKGVDFVNGNLINSWSIYLQRIRSAHQAVFEQIIRYPEVPNSVKSLADHRVGALKTTIVEQSKEQLINLRTSLEREIINRALKSSDEFREQIDELDVRSKGSIHIQPSERLMNVNDIRFSQNLIRPHASLQADADKVQKDTYKKLIELFTQVKDACSAIKSHLNTLTPLKTYKQIIDEARENLSNSVEGEFLNVVNLYRVAVFSAGSRQSYFKLGLDIGSQMDQLEHDFGDEQKEYFIRTAVDKVFGETDKTYNQFLITMNSLHNRMEEYERNTLGVIENQIPNKPAAITESEINISIAALELTLADRVRNDVNDLVEQMHDKIQSTINGSVERYDKDVIIKRRRHWWTLVGWTLTGGFAAFLLFYVGLSVFNQGAVSNTPAMTILYSVVGSIVTGILSFFLAGIINNLPALIDTVTTEFNNNLHRECKKIIKTEIDNRQLKGVSVADLERYLVGSWQECLIEKVYDSWGVQGNKFIDSLGVGVKELSVLTQEFTTLVDSVTNVYSSHFDNFEAKTDNLKLVADNIRKEAIQPSFVLLNSTTTELTNLKNAIESVTFR